MTLWLLDDGPFGQLAKQFDPSWSFPEATIHVVQDVADAASGDKSGRSSKLLALGTPRRAVRVHRPSAASEAVKYLFGHIRPRDPFASKNMGEDVAIALAATELRDAVFVTLDKQAAFVALAELGPARVATPLDVWWDLFRSAHVTRSQHEALVTATVKGSNLPGPPRRFMGDALE